MGFHPRSHTAHQTTTTKPVINGKIINLSSGFKIPKRPSNELPSKSPPEKKVKLSDETNESNDKIKQKTKETTLATTNKTATINKETSKQTANNVKVINNKTTPKASSTPVSTINKTPINKVSIPKPVVKSKFTFNIIYLKMMNLINYYFII